MSRLSSAAELVPAADTSLVADDGVSRMAADLQRAIESGTLASGSRLRPLREMARQYGISVPTAQRVMVRLEEAGLVHRRQGAGVFVVYRGAVAAPPDATAMMLVSHHDPVFDRFAARVSEGLTASGIQPVRPAWSRAQMPTAIQPWLETWREQPPRVVILQRSAPGVPEALERVCGGRTLLIEAFRLPTDPTSFHRVNPDYARACHLAVQRFLERGHRRIGFTTHRRPVRPAGDDRFQKRWSGHTYQILELGRALRDAGIRRHGLTIHYTHTLRENGRSAPLHPTNIERAMRWLAARDGPTAVFGDDNRVAPIIRAAERLGLRIGKDLDVLGQGNTDWSEAMNFPSIEYQPELVADEVLALIRRNASATVTSRHEIAVPVQLIER